MLFTLAFLAAVSPQFSHAEELQTAELCTSSRSESRIAAHYNDLARHIGKTIWIRRPGFLPTKGFRSTQPEWDDRNSYDSIVPFLLRPLSPTAQVDDGLLVFEGIEHAQCVQIYTKQYVKDLSEAGIKVGASRDQIPGE